jgi:hypothetical protein
VGVVLDDRRTGRVADSEHLVHLAPDTGVVNGDDRVRSVTAAATALGSMFSVSGRMSTKTGTAPRSANALAVDTKVKEGITTSSPASRSRSSAASSRASVQEVVRRTLAAPSTCSRQASACFVKVPLPEMWPASSAAAMYSRSRPTKLGRLKGMS